MNREQLCHAIRAACAIAEIDRVIVVGSQSILGSFDTDELPAVTHLSAEVDVMPDVSDFDLMVRLSDLIEGVGGELSPFEELHGFALDGVDLTTSVLPLGWRDRLVVVRNEFTKDPVTGKQYSGLCLDPADLCVAKLCAGREKDRAFVAALFDADLVDRDLVRTRLVQMPAEHSDVAAIVLAELDT
ncbi:MAG: hypothetical protein QM582_17530 [Micropruina sp.]|uniref:DUF6036 family nucleotidyltransferase n=1 Tax=Micropruina sp. TaxID=2737536 RepID=UPI0039E618F0